MSPSFHKTTRHHTITVTVDVGNSHTVIGIFRDSEILEYWRITTRADATADEAFLRISSLVNHSHIKASQVTHVGLSTVVPTLERTWGKALDFMFHQPVQVVTERNCLDLPLSYANPSQLGSDRICNVLAMRDMGLQNAIAVDMGTATSFDVMKDGAFYGGVIIPGINASLEVLTQKAARLMPVTLDWPDHVIAKATDDALRAGLLYGFMGQLEYLLNGIRREMGAQDVQILATGGWSGLLMERTDVINTYDPYLTIKGIRLVALHGNGG
ncbi:MAG TPA: type III pantothenate kinase [Fibrobacteraceae bacterium]|nr:type III pantothenate kinase [Fibrobacteraceae bacterium]